VVDQSRQPKAQLQRGAWDSFEGPGTTELETVRVTWKALNLIRRAKSTVKQESWSTTNWRAGIMVGQVSATKDAVLQNGAGLGLCKRTSNAQRQQRGPATGGC